jgi:hypothetical protein
VEPVEDWYDAIAESERIRRVNFELSPEKRPSRPVGLILRKVVKFERLGYFDRAVVKEERDWERAKGRKVSNIKVCWRVLVVSIVIKILPRSLSDAFGLFIQSHMVKSRARMRDVVVV